MKVILGSQSPRRRELLAGVVPSEQLHVVPPQRAEEPGFDGLQTAGEIERQLQNVVALKHCDVLSQLTLEDSSGMNCCTVCADTIVVAGVDENRSVVLEKPPTNGWQPIVRRWFRDYYSGRSHEVWTGCRITAAGQRREFIVKTRVFMCPQDDWLIDWYLSTGESVGKAGGYGIQGRAAMLVEKVDGSLTNVVGLPLREVVNVLREFGVLTSEGG